MSIQHVIDEALECFESPPPNESNTCEWVILPLLWAAGYSRREIHSRVQDSNGQYPDYTLLPDDREHRWWVEAKAWNVRLEHTHANQSLNYANQNGGRWVLLTNGQTWRLYDNHIHAEAAQKLIAEVSLRDRPKFERFLTAIGKESVLTGKRDQFACEARLHRILETQLIDRASPVMGAIYKSLRALPGLEAVQVDAVIDFFRTRTTTDDLTTQDARKGSINPVGRGNGQTFLPVGPIPGRSGTDGASVARELVRDLVHELIDSTPGLTRPVSRNQKYIRFHSVAWNSPLLIVDQGGKRERILYLEVISELQEANIYSFVGPGPAEMRQRLVEMAARHAPPFVLSGRLSAEKWTRVYKHPLTAGVDYGSADRTALEQAIRSHWERFAHNDLPQLNDAVRSEKWLWES